MTQAFPHITKPRETLCAELFVGQGILHTLVQQPFPCICKANIRQDDLAATQRSAGPFHISAAARYDICSPCTGHMGLNYGCLALPTFPLANPTPTCNSKVDGCRRRHVHGQTPHLHVSHSRGFFTTCLLSAMRLKHESA